MPRKIQISICLLALSVLVAAAAKPNLVLVMADDQGWGDMAYNGHPFLKTPNFDTAAASGLRFDRFYAAAPVCSPTRASVMTGRHPNRIGVFQWGYTLRPQEITLAEALKSAGYVTAHFGKWHLGSVRKGSPVHPGASGFDEWLSAPNFYDNDPILSHHGVAEKLEGESSVVTAKRAIAWMKQQATSTEPFFCVVWFGSPHLPHRAAKEDFATYADQPEAYAHFLGEISGMDRAFGMIRNSLSEMGVRENTLLWYTSDNGALPKVGSSGNRRGHKGQIYEGGLLVPAFLEWPAVVKSPRTTDMRCNTSDIYPTLLDLVGISMPHQPTLDGVSLAELIRGNPSPPHAGMGFWDFPISGKPTPAHKLMLELWNAQAKGVDLPPAEDSLNAAAIDPLPTGMADLAGHAAWIEANWKLHRISNSQTGETKFELYQLFEDPAESTDLAEQEPERLAAMRGKLESWMKSVVQSYQGADYRGSR